MKAILIDDETDCLETLEFDLQKNCPEVLVLEKCNSAKSGIEAIEKLKPDVVFLDIEMPFMNGFELLNQISEINFALIFVTAYDQFAIRAFDFSAIDYLLKPLDTERLKNAVEKVKTRKNKFNSNDLAFLLANLKGMSAKIPKLALPTYDGFEFVKTENILFAESENSETFVILENKERIKTTKTLRDLEKMLEIQNFVRVHNGFLVNLSHIKKYIRGQSGGEILMSNNTEIPVSKAGKNKLLELVKI